MEVAPTKTILVPMIPLAFLLGASAPEGTDANLLVGILVVLLVLVCALVGLSIQHPHQERIKTFERHVFTPGHKASQNQCADVRGVRSFIS